jgi:hypothetical protein
MERARAGALILVLSLTLDAEPAEPTRVEATCMFPGSLVANWLLSGQMSQ